MWAGMSLETAGSNRADVRIGSIAPNAAGVLQQRMSVAPRKRQLATKVRRVVKGQQRSFACAEVIPSGATIDHCSVDSLSEFLCFTKLIDMRPKLVVLGRGKSTRIH